MVHSVGGSYSTPPGWVERITREQGSAAQPDSGDRGARQAAPSFDPQKAASISDLANRSVSYRGAIRSLEEISTYLNELI